MIYTNEHEMFRESLRGFINREIQPYVNEWEQKKRFPYKKIYKMMGDEGFLGLSYPTEYGGLGLDYGYTVILGEELGCINSGGIPMSISVQTDMCTPAIAKYGSHLLKKEFLQPAIYGEKIGCIAVTEPNAGSDSASIDTTATKQGRHYIINGYKSYITNGGIADFVVTLCRTSDDGIKGLSLIVIPTNVKGFTVMKNYEKLGNWTSNQALLHFKNVCVPEEFLIGEEGTGFNMQMEQFMRERLILSVISHSQAKQIINKAKVYAKNRSTFNNSLIKNQHIGFKLVNLEIDLEFLQQMINHTVGLFMSGKECTRELAMIKLKSSQLLRKSADECLQIFGGYGYMEDSGIPRIYRDARAASIAGGTDEIMLYLLQKYL